MTHPPASAAAAATDASTQDAVPEDLRFAAHFAPASIDDCIRAARAEVNRYKAVHHRPTFISERGPDALAPETYRREMHRRRSVLFRLMHLKSQQENPA